MDEANCILTWGLEPSILQPQRKSVIKGGEMRVKYAVTTMLKNQEPWMEGGTGQAIDIKLLMFLIK
jgi:hypothetical protein